MGFFVKFKFRKFERGFKVDEEGAESIKKSLADPQKMWIVMETATGGKEYINFRRCFGVEFIPDIA